MGGMRVRVRMMSRRRNDSRNNNVSSPMFHDVDYNLKMRPIRLINFYRMHSVMIYVSPMKYFPMRGRIRIIEENSKNKNKDSMMTATILILRLILIRILILILILILI